MDEKKRQTVEEIAKIIYKDFQAPSRYIAEKIYNAGYRKESDTAKEILTELKNTRYIVNEVICLKCYKRWIAVRPQQTNLADLVCPQCNESGYAICTGQEFDIDE